ncbi:MAG: outer membrane protein assembly factor BamE [Pseudomonadota bacterium]
MNNIKSLRILGILLLSLVTGGCHVYKINIQQGNYLKDEKLAQLEVGMTKRQVRFLLGSPIVQDAFHPDRWDYVFWFKNGRDDSVLQRKLTVVFEGDTVADIVLPDDYVAPAEAS